MLFCLLINIALQIVEMRHQEQKQERQLMD